MSEVNPKNFRYAHSYDRKNVAAATFGKSFLCQPDNVKEPD